MKIFKKLEKKSELLLMIQEENKLMKSDVVNISIIINREKLELVLKISSDSGITLMVTETFKDSESSNTITDLNKFFSIFYLKNLIFKFHFGFMIKLMK